MSNVNLEMKPDIPTNTRTFNVSDYGAVADGKTNDGIAISMAIAAAAADKSAYKVVKFEENVTYYVAGLLPDNEDNSIISLDKAENITILGKNTRFLIKAPIRVAHIFDCTNIKMEGFVIDYSPKPFILGKVTAFNTNDGTIDFHTDGDLGFSQETFTPPPANDYFALPNSGIRYHYFITSYVKLSDLNAYRMNVAKNTQDRIEKVHIGDEFILPYAGVGHTIDAAFNIYRNYGFELLDCTIHSLPQFGFNIRFNKDRMYFTNVNFVPSADSNIKLVAWRDGFHVKDNIKPIVWDNCTIGPLGDDAFNFSCVLYSVYMVSPDQQTFSMYPDEGTDAQPVNEGDEFIAYDLVHGSLFGEAKVKKVLSQISSGSISFQADKVLPNLKQGTKIGFYKNANLGSVIKNCYIEGTVRVRGSVTFENTNFNVFWVHVENEINVEGPIPKDITFRHCTFTTPSSADDVILKISTFTTGFSENCEYKCKNILVEDCTFLKGKMYIQPGSEVIIR